MQQGLQLAPQQSGEAQPKLLLCLEQEGGRDEGRAPGPTYLCLQAGMKAELCCPGLTPGKQSLQLTLAPQPSHMGASELEMVPWKLCANMQIISLCRWHEVAHTEQIKAWQLQRWGK